MSNINENIFQNFCLLSQKVQGIQKKIEKETVTPEVREELHKELEGVQSSLETLRQNALHTQSHVNNQFSQLDEMDKQVISLYREIEERFEECEISLISKEALELSSSLGSGKMTQVAKKIDSIKHNVHFLFQHRRPSLQHRKIIHLALKLVDHASDLLKEGHPPAADHLKTTQILQTLLTEILQRIEPFPDTQEAELVMELYEIADLIYQKQETEGLLKLKLIQNKLSKPQQRRLDAMNNSPEELIGSLLEIADGDPCYEWESSSQKEGVLQSLYA